MLDLLRRFKYLTESISTTDAPTSVIREYEASGREEDSNRDNKIEISADDTADKNGIPDNIPTGGDKKTEIRFEERSPEEDLLERPVFERLIALLRAEKLQTGSSQIGTQK